MWWTILLGISSAQPWTHTAASRSALVLAPVPMSALVRPKPGPVPAYVSVGVGRKGSGDLPSAAQVS